MKGSVSNNILVAAIALTVNFSTQASAETTGDHAAFRSSPVVSSISVPYARADLVSDEGLANLYGKIRHAARSVCGPTTLREAGSLSLMSRNKKCYEEAVSAALSQVGSRQLTAITD